LATHSGIDETKPSSSNDRSFIRGVLSGDFNLDFNKFGSYKVLANFINERQDTLVITVNNIAQLKRRPLNKRKLIMDQDKLVIAFLDSVSKELPEFDRKSFLGK